ncbi:hypothetical protein B0H19DRAFT_1252514 [Mycena capillaripes]|nr:hypothetical protein B0H19DRAFT_1265735 [Mycena capillaripes]KAJ6582417.1 hypothetical protein B0H19DRAFT_1252514 [Mycena capillaripes]
MSLIVRDPALHDPASTSGPDTTSTRAHRRAGSRPRARTSLPTHPGVASTPTTLSGLRKQSRLDPVSTPAPPRALPPHSGPERAPIARVGQDNGNSTLRACTSPPQATDDLNLAAGKSEPSWVR